MATTKTSVKKTPAKKTPAKKTSAKKTSVTAKVSPLRGTPIDAWVAQKAKGWHAETIHRLMDLLRAAIPTGSFSIKWGQPVFDSDGPMAFIRPAKAHVTLGFWRGSELKDPKGVLEGAGSRMAHVKLREGEPIDAKQLTAFAKQAAKLNKSKGDPSKR